MEKKEIIPALNNRVIYDGTEYILTAYFLRKSKDGRLIHDAELRDMRANSVMYVPLEQVNNVKEE